MNEKAQARVEQLFGSSPLETTDPEFAALIGNFSQDEVVSAGSLTERERMLCILAALLGVQGHSVFKGIVKGALTAGIDAVSIKEVVYQATAYLGIGRTYAYLQAVNAILEENGISLPLEGQSTTTPETRFEKGLDKQVEVFGEGMRTRQSDPGPRRNVNRWLADNCFGDYYTRGGLSYQEREMITFCFILSQGGCENQLRAHAAGNIIVGNGRERLYQFVEQCMPYIGYPRMLNALAVVDEVTK